VLQPALVRQLRYSQYDLKDNVALLVLFEPHSMHSTAEAGPASTQAGPLLQQQVQPQLSSPQLQQQERQEQQSQQQHKQDLISQWLPRSWRNSSSGGSASGQPHHQQHSKMHLRPAPQLRANSGSSSGSGGLHSLYQLPVHVQTQRSRSWAGNGPTYNNSSSPSALGERSSSKSSSKSGRLGRLGSRSKSSRNAAGGQANAAAAAAAGSSSDGMNGAPATAVEQVQLAPEWQRCGLLVANTHIIFTPDKGEVKLGQVGAHS
jgi:hypothetical protein